MRVLLTGASGFVGRHLAAALLARGDKVVAVVRDPSAAPAGCEVLQHDLTAGAPGLDGVDAVVHAAAVVPADLRDPGEAERCWRVNGLASLHLALATRAAGLRLVHLSSGNVYAPGPSPAAEGAPTYPANRATPYLASKLCGELYVANAAPDALILRPSSVYGPGMRGGVVATFLQKLRAGAPITATHGPYRADFVWVHDVVTAALSGLDGPVAGPVNVGSGRPVGMDTLAFAVAAALDRPASLVTVQPQAGADPGFAPLDVSRAAEALGLRPTPLEDGLRALAAT